MVIRKPLVNWQHLIAGLALTCVLMLSGQAQAFVDDPSACGAKLVVTGTYCLGSDLTVGSVRIKPGAVLCTNAFTLTISCPGGLSVEGPDGKLEISAGGSVVLTGGGTSTVDGLVTIQGAISILSIADNDHTIVGNGTIDLQNAAATIDIGVLKTFTSEILIQGQGQIEGRQLAGNRGAFVNNGTVEANVNNCVLEVTSDTILSGSGAWKVTTCPVGTFDAGATLRISRAATGLTGSFTIDGGVLDIDANVTTNVDIFYNKGKIDIASNATFTFGDGVGPDSSGTCDAQPASPLSNEVSKNCGC